MKKSYPILRKTLLSRFAGSIVNQNIRTWQKIGIVLAITLTAFSCLTPLSGDGEKDEEYISFALTGANVAKTYKITGASLAGGAIFFTKNNYTSISVNNDPDKKPHRLGVTFPGKGAGRYEWTPFSMNLIAIDEDGQPPYPLFIPHEGYTEVTEYGSVDEKIEGNLAGILIEVHNGDFYLNDTLNISGTFSVYRRADYNP
jgi:hypothetical protein